MVSKSRSFFNEFYSVAVILYEYIEFILVLGCGIKGNIETLDNRPDIKSRNVEMRNELDLFANVLHCHSRPGVKTRHDNIDVVVIRQNTEGIQII